jgi:hypothetical protein
LFRVFGQPRARQGLRACRIDHAPIGVSKSFRLRRRAFGAVPIFFAAARNKPGDDGLISHVGRPGFETDGG